MQNHTISLALIFKLKKTSGYNYVDKIKHVIIRIIN